MQCKQINKSAFTRTLLKTWAHKHLANKILLTKNKHTYKYEHTYIGIYSSPFGTKTEKTSIQIEQITNLHNHQWEIKTTNKSLVMQRQEMCNNTDKQTPKQQNKRRKKHNKCKQITLR